MRPSLPRLVLIGDISRAEFREVGTVLEDVGNMTRFVDAAAATAAIGEGLPDEDSLAAHGIVLFQAYPDQFSAAAIDSLRRLAPLARIFVILGSWCEGEARSGHPLPGVIRIFWHQAAVRIRREFPCWSQADTSIWRLPATATDEEHMIASIRAPLPKGNGLVAIWTRQLEMHDLLADACGSAGYSTAWLHPRHPTQVRGPVAAIYDGAVLDAAGRTELEHLSAAISPARVLALLDAPRIQDVRLVRTLGAAVLAKPFRIDEMLWELSLLSRR